MFLLVSFVLSAIVTNVWADDVVIPGRLLDTAPYATTFKAGPRDGIWTMNQEKNPGDYVEYNIDVPETGEYVLWLQLGAKANSSLGLRLAVKVEGATVHTMNFNNNLFIGDWQAYSMFPFPLTLEAGQRKVRVENTVDGARWGFPIPVWSNPRNNFIVKPDATFVLQDKFAASAPFVIADSLLITPHHTSSNGLVNNAISFGGGIWHKGGSRYGDNKAVLVTGYSHSGTDADGGISKINKTQLKYMIEVPEEGVYSVDLGGYFVLRRTNNGDPNWPNSIANYYTGTDYSQATFPVVLTGTWQGAGGEQKFFEETITYPQVPYSINLDKKN